MNKTNSSGLSQELLDDFFAEADEHLLNIRRTLLGLEKSEIDYYDPKIIGELFHNFHSFKGISAIAGLDAAEALAHAAEDLLRLLRSREVRSSEKVLNVLNAVTHRLEQIVAAFRTQKPLPEYESLLAEIKGQHPSATFSDTGVPPVKVDPPTLSDSIEKARLRGLSVWKYTFSPSHELNAREININTIREQLSLVGEILKSTPVVKGQGIITFEFLIATKRAPKDRKKWQARGVTIEPAGEQEGPPMSILPTAQPATAENIHSPFLAPSHIVRVDLKRLDDLLRIVGEMVVRPS